MKELERKTRKQIAEECGITESELVVSMNEKECHHLTSQLAANVARSLYNRIVALENQIVKLLNLDSI